MGRTKLAAAGCRLTTDLLNMASDHLSSASLMMDASGATVSSQRYLPFGEVRHIDGLTDITQTDLGYTGQRNYTYINLLDYGARWYSTPLGRFTQPDTIVPDLTDTQAWNRYAYVENSPIRYNDPTGHSLEDRGICPDGDCSVYDDDDNYNAGNGVNENNSGGDGNTGGNDNQPGNLGDDLEESEGRIGTHPGGLKLTENGEPIITCVTGKNGTMVCFVQMPPGTAANINPPSTSATGWGYTGVAIDVAEAILSANIEFLPITEGASALLGIGDAIVALKTCYEYGECYIGSPGYDLPTMIVGNSDLMVNSAEMVVGPSLTAVGDVVTSAGSAAFDLGRTNGAIENFVSVGFSFLTPGKKVNTAGVIYIIYYP
jgi:RHS repeat-associated protein